MEQKCEHCSVFSSQCDDEKQGRERNIHHVELCVCACVRAGVHRIKQNFRQAWRFPLIKTVGFSLLL